ncbi:pitrilysin family protein [Acaryochloris sp. IP29b_bin.148]|uniref:M16 family metallopeptidase n=1 Tax=Acaryochloris sp. IP29b_bin.148 TaxID=2969218 RepID=UPI002639A463|nr:pitrilysin family protein [Acaryochloris sp. IP29b_bin.148]
MATLNPTCHRTPEGLTIIAEHLPVDAVNFSLWVNAGSAVEGDAINGMAHFLEHMVFKGTERLPEGEFERQVEARGGVTNAVTSQDYTCFYVTVAPQDFAEIAPLQIDLALNACLDADSFERERLVILEEIRRADDNARRRLFQQAMTLGFTDLPYRRPVLGPAEVVQGLAREQMHQHHQSWFHPENLTAVVVGNLPTDQMIRTVEEEFSQTTAPPPPPPLFTPEPTFTEIVRHTACDPQLTQARLVMLWRVPGIQQLSQTYALDLIARLLGGSRNARLVKALREEQQLVEQISVSNLTQAWQGLFWISAQLPSAHLKQVEAAIVTHLQQLQEELAPEPELAQRQRQLLNQHLFGTEVPSSRADWYGYHHAIAHNLDAGLQYPHQIQQLTAADVQQAAQTYLSPTAYGVLTLLPGP